MTTAPPIPRPLARGLGRVRRKLVMVRSLSGLGLTALAMALIAAAGMALDFLLPLPIAASWGLWIAWIGVGGFLFLGRALAPLVISPGARALAAVAERDRPEFGERLTSTVELLSADRPPHGSPELIAVLADDAARRAREANLAASVPAHRAAITFALGALVAALVVAPAFVRPDPFATLARRFVMPWAALERAGRLMVSVEPGDAVVAVGSDVPIVATLRARFGPIPKGETARLEWEGSDGRSQSARMTADEGGPSFRLTLPRLGESVRYRVRTDSAEAATHRLTAVEPPAIAKIEARITPPAYTKLPPTVAKRPERIEAWEGSRIAVMVTPNKPIASARLEWPADDPKSPPAEATRTVAMTTGDGGKTWTATVPAEASGSYAFRLEDEYKIPNRPEPPRRLVVRPDAPPTILLGGSPEPRDAQADDLLVVELLARDDLAVMGCEMLYTIERSATSGGAAPTDGEVAARVNGLTTRSARGEASLSLKGLNLKSGDVLTYRIRAEDSRPAPRGPNVTLSPPRSLRIVDKAEPLLTREHSSERLSLQEQLTAIKKLAAETRQGAEALRYAADAAGRGNGRWDDARQGDLTRREAAARSIVDRLQTLARDFADSGRFVPLERPARQIAEVEAEAGRETLDAARRAPDATRRLGDLRTADDRLASLQGRLDELQAKFDELGRLDDDRRKLRELAERQEELARKAEELARSGGDREELERVRQEQERLRQELDALARRSPELRAEALAARAKEADDLAKRARELADKQREEAKKSADPAGRADRLRELAEMQKRIEDDARRLALKVDRPLMENDRGRLDAGALARPIEPLERGEIEAGRQGLEAAEGTLRRLARDLADVRDDPKALARRLARRQESIKNEVMQAIRQAATPEQKAALPEALNPLTQRQEAIAKLAAAIPVPDDLKNQAKEAKDSAERAANDLKERKNDQVENHQNEARDRLNRLADALPDANARRQRALQAMREAKGRTDQVSRELDEHLRATAPRPDQKDFDPEAAARDLARRVAPLADRMGEAARHLAEARPDRDAEPQLDRALDRVRDLADALDELRDGAPAESAPIDAKSPAGWRILGSFDDARMIPPFPIDRPIDLKAAFEGRKKTHPTWRPVEPGPEGKIDLGSFFAKEDNTAAFGYVEVESPDDGRGRLLIGSDDTLAVWLNGKRVYDFNNGRSYAPAQDRVDVIFAKGTNRLLVRCGNLNSEWAFSVAVQTPRSPESSRRLAAFQRVREALPATKTDAAAAMERLEQKMQGQEPADDRAREIAQELRAEPEAGEGPAGTLERAATALRNLKAPDAIPQRAEALRAVEQAGEAAAEHRPDAAEARARAAKAAEALADRLADADAPGEQAGGLADAEAGLDAADAPQDVRERAAIQRAIADQAAAIEGESPRAPAARDSTRRAAEMADRAAQNPDAAPAADRQKAARHEAAEALAALAHEPGAGAEPDPADRPPANASPRDAAHALAARQRDLARRADQMKGQAEQAAKGDDAAKARVAEALGKLADQEEQIAEATRDLPDPHAAGTPPQREAEQAREAARSAAARAAGALDAHDPGRAAASANRAADALEDLARKLPEAAPAPAAVPQDPDLAIAPEHAAEAQNLARRERTLREKLQGLLADRVEAQEDLRAEAANLGRDLANLRDSTRDLSPKAQGPANNAAGIVQNQAPPAMQEGEQHLAAGRPDPARDAQRRAAEALARAADQAEDIAAALRSEAPAEAMAQAEANAAGQGPGQAQGQGEGQPADLASAREAQREAARELASGRDSPEAAGPSAQAAAQAMHQAAQGLRAAASASSARSASSLASREKGMPHEGAQSTPKEGETGPADPHLAELQAAVRARTGRNWGELPGHLRSEILQMSRGQYRDDYARLIGLYFREIAAGRDDERPGTKP